MNYLYRVLPKIFINIIILKSLSNDGFQMKNSILIFAWLFLAITPLHGNGDFEIKKRFECKRPKKNPTPPKLPRNFSWKGRYVVPFLIDPATGKKGITIPFTWVGKDGDIQMIAGSENDPIYFTNFIYQGHLYTYTYKWPGLQKEFLPPLESCAPLLPFTLEDFNALLDSATYVGQEILLHPHRYVNHFRVTVVTPPPQPSGFYPRLPLMLGDFYVDRKDPSKFWQVLHFGVQNIYTPDLDEWIILEEFKDCPGEIILPPLCFP